MSSLYSLFAAVLLVQSAYSQCLNYGRPEVVAPAVAVNSLGSSCNGLGVNTIGVNGLGYNGLGSNNLGLESGLGLGFGNIQANGGDSFVVSSGSANTPNGVSIVSENEFGGVLASTGVLPFASSVGTGGNLQSAGQAAVNYATAPGAALLEGGCGLGLSGAGIGAYNGLGLGNVNSLGLGNTNSLGLGNTNSLGLGNTNSLGLGNTNSLGLANTNSLGLSNVNSVGLANVNAAYGPGIIGGSSSGCGRVL